MLPTPNPLKPGGRKSPFPDSSGPKRRRVSDSPRPPLSTGDMTMNPRPAVTDRCPGARVVFIERQLPLPVMIPGSQPYGPDPDANKLLGYAPRQYGSYTQPLLHDSNLGPHLRPGYFIRGDGSWLHECREVVQQRGAVYQRDTPTPTPTSIERAIMHGQQPTPPHSDPMRPSHSHPMGPPQTPTPLRPHRFKVPQRELAVQLVEFEELAAHTAKCDVCDKRNTDGMVRCKPCGWQCCRRCLAERGGDRAHPKAGNLHVPDDTPHTKRPDLNSNKPMMITPSPGDHRPNASERTPRKYASPEEEAAKILMGMKYDSWDRVGPRRANGHIAGPYRALRAVVAGSHELDSDETEMLPDIGSETETDEENLPDCLVNVRRNPSRKARPAEMKE